MASREMVPVVEPDLPEPSGPAARRNRGVLGSLATAVVRSPKALVGVVILGIFVVMAVGAPLIAPYDPHDTEFGRAEGPSGAHWLGTTTYGQDVLSQLVYGSRQSLLIALLVGGFATLVSALLGVAAAYVGDVADHVLSLVTDIFLVIPGLPLLIVISSYIRGGGLMVMVGVIVFTSWAYGARQFRAQALSLRHREFLEAARVRGERTSYTIVFEILPTMTGLLVANFLGAAVGGVLAVAGLQFIGLGDITSISWGSMMHWAENNEALQAGSPLWDLAPGLCIALLGASFALINYAFDEVSNPALRPPRRRRRGRAVA
ncbi:ABC transporter permease [Actinopolymorpha alba]|uniref:ABC transporter permease n=1 Tax=Actinopolymorpha alba TaxID=533267 RepID=UPI00037BF097|nr:ABC transporter permease [Actinopolymorpha alba]